MSPVMPELPEQRVDSFAETGIVLAFDFGLQRIGVAVGECLLAQARPLTAIDTANKAARFAAIARLVDEWQPVRVIVGLPRSVDGEGYALTQRCRRFARQLHGRFGLAVDLVDERFSSCAAVSRLGGRIARSDKGRIDAEAAAILLQDWFDHAATRRC